jgi:2-polyprenyl-6-methoxyphenol hydroxylase-like FAD-dependent oxidoreductase
VKFFPIFRLPLGGKWAGGRRLLLGDAAHAMQPHSGQGVSMALHDPFLLSRLLEASSPTVSLSTLFVLQYPKTAGREVLWIRFAEGWVTKDNQPLAAVA